MSRVRSICTLLAASAAFLLVACASFDEEEIEDELDDSEEMLAASSCDPSIANGAVPAKHRALLDTIAFTEGTKGRGEDGYNVIFTYRYFTSCQRHPNRRYCSGSLCSTAAGRYQFLDTTWAGLRLPNFRPDNQERGAMKLVVRRQATIPTGRALTATEFTNVMNRLSWEWASLPPGRYGQPSYSMAATRRKYCTFADCGGGGGGGGGTCVAGGQYCGGNRLTGDRSTLYRCNGSAAPTVIARCTAGCQIMPAGSDDMCRGAGGCVAGGRYCGGNKVSGDPRTLYRCTGGSAGTPVQHCESGCSINPGRDDSCR